jgi:ankyrin repeat protein
MTLGGTRETMRGLGSSLRSLINELPEDLEELLDFSEGEQAKGRPESWTPLHYTAQEGNLTLCRAMLEKGAFVDPRDSHNLTPLACAANQGHLDVCNLLLEFGADPDSKADYGLTPLVPAGIKGHLDVMSLLLSKGADIDTRLSIGLTLLGFIIGAGAFMNEDSAYDVAKFVLENGSDPNASGNTFAYPLMLAAMSSDVRFAKLLLAYNADVNLSDSASKSPLLCAASQNNLEMVQLLLQYGADPKAAEETLWTALHLSAQHDHPHTLDVVMLLIASQDVDVNAKTVDNVTALYLAVQSNRVDVAECLIAAGADLDISTDKDIRALELAIVKSNLAMVNLLLDHGADPQRVDERGLSILHVAAAGKSNVATIKRILEEDIDLDLRSHGMAQATALHVAVRANKVDIVECLLVAGANVEIESGNDVTALEIAVGLGNLAMVNLLLDHGADSQRVDKQGLSLLHVAAMQGDVAVLKRILEEGIDLELRTYNSPSKTALHIAVANDNNEIALTLLEHGALP